MPINAVVRSVSGWAVAVLIVGIVLVWRHLQTLAKCKANEPYKDDQCEKWPHPIRHGRLHPGRNLRLFGHYTLAGLNASERQ